MAEIEVERQASDDSKYTLTLTFQTAAGTTLTTAPTVSPQIHDIMVTPMGAATPINSTGEITDLYATLELEDTNTPAIYTLDYQRNAPGRNTWYYGKA